MEVTIVSMPMDLLEIISTSIIAITAGILIWGTITNNKRIENNQRGINHVHGI